MKFKIIQERSLVEMEEAVQNALDFGWILQGSLVSNGSLWAQCVIKLK